MNRARAIIARAGYTTIMDLVVLRQDAILIPTPGMTEQVHLAKRHPRVEIGGQTGYAFRYAALPEAIRAWNVEDTLKTILGVIGWDRHVDCAILKCDESTCETPQ
jgi:predicted glycosyltransferase